ncbi:MAG: thioredoxin peroxidase [Anaerolineaceae bacterium]|nr:thioredoxin peroxidase [Anaerolineaceae bacterium]
MAQLRQDYDQFTQRDAEVVVVGPESADKFAKYFQENDLPYIGLPDPKHTVLKMYKQQVKLLKLGRMPSQTVVDKNGMIQFAHFGKSMQDIPTTEDMIEILDKLNA